MPDNIALATFDQDHKTSGGLTAGLDDNDSVQMLNGSESGANKTDFEQWMSNGEVYRDPNLPLFGNVDIAVCFESRSNFEYYIDGATTTEKLVVRFGQGEYKGCSDGDLIMSIQGITMEKLQKKIIRRMGELEEKFKEFKENGGEDGENNEQLTSEQQEDVQKLKEMTAAQVVEKLFYVICREQIDFVIAHAAEPLAVVYRKLLEDPKIEDLRKETSNGPEICQTFLEKNGIFEFNGWDFSKDPDAIKRQQMIAKVEKEMGTLSFEKLDVLKKELLGPDEEVVATIQGVACQVLDPLKTVEAPVADNIGEVHILVIRSPMPETFERRRRASGSAECGESDERVPLQMKYVHRLVVYRESDIATGFSINEKFSVHEAEKYLSGEDPVVEEPTHCCYCGCWLSFCRCMEGTKAWFYNSFCCCCSYEAEEEEALRIQYPAFKGENKLGEYETRISKRQDLDTFFLEHQLIDVKFGGYSSMISKIVHKESLFNTGPYDDWEQKPRDLGRECCSCFTCCCPGLFDCFRCSCCCSCWLNCLSCCRKPDPLPVPTLAKDNNHMAMEYAIAVNQDSGAIESALYQFKTDEKLGEFEKLVKEKRVRNLLTLTFKDQWRNKYQTVVIYVDPKQANFKSLAFCSLMHRVMGPDAPKRILQVTEIQGMPPPNLETVNKLLESEADRKNRVLANAKTNKSTWW